MKINTDEQKQSQSQENKAPRNTRTLPHQGSSIAQGICPDTLQPMRRKYFLSEDFLIYYSKIEIDF